MAASFTIDADETAHSAVLATTGDEEMTYTTAAASVGASETWTLSFDAKASAASIARVRGVIQPLTSAGAVNGAATSGTLTALTTAWTRVSVTMATPASTDKAQLYIRFQNAASTSVTVYVRNVQFEEAAAATTFRVGEQTVANRPNSTSGQGRYALFYNAGSAPTPVVTNIIGDASSNLTSAFLALRSQGGVGTPNITDYINTRNYLSWSDGTLGTNASLSGDSDTASSDALSISFASEDMLKRVRVDASTLLDAISGEFEVFVRCKSSNVSSNFNLALHWAPSNTDPATISLAPVGFDNTDAASTSYVELSLGRISVPTDVALAGVAFELWAERTEGSGTLSLDTISFAPADECVGEVTMPTAASSITWPGSSLVPASTGATAVSGDPAFGSSVYSSPYVAMNAANEIVSGPASSSTQGGVSLPGGRARFTFNVIHDPGKVYTVIYRVVDTGPTGTDAVMASHTQVHLGGSTASEVMLEFDTTAGEYYQPQVYLSSWASGSLNVASMSSSLTPSVTEDERIYIDPDTYSVHKLDSGGSLVTPLRHTGQLPFYAPPGLSAIYMHFGDLPISGLDGTVTTLTREPTVRFQYSPQDWA